MPLERPDLHSMLTRIRAGDEDAARELLVHFEPHVRRVVRRRLPSMLRSKFDSLDFVQSVWGDFFARLNRGQIDFDTEAQLAKFLAVVARSKVANETRRRAALKFDVRKEVDLGTGVIKVPGKNQDPTPSQNYAAHERLALILSGRPQVHKKVLEMRSEGFTFHEIADQLEIDERTARRIVEAVEKELGLNNVGQ